jgi:hypothetical protein
LVVQQSGCSDAVLNDGLEVLANSLINASFDKDRYGNVCTACSSSGCDNNFYTNPGWQRVEGTPTQRNGAFFRPHCLGGAYASMQGGNFTSGWTYYQTVSGLTPGIRYLFSGKWAGGTSTGNQVTWAAELREGTDTVNGPLIGQYTEVVNSGHTAWSDFVVNGVPATGTVTVAVRVLPTSYVNLGFHVDNCSLVVSPCQDFPGITAVGPNFAANDQASVALTITGSNLDDGSNPTLVQVKLTRAGVTDIQASNVAVVDPQILTCQVNLSGTAPGRYNVVATKPDCGTATFTSGFLVILPALTNGDFSLPSISGDQCQESNVAPAPWQSVQAAGWGGTLARNTNRYKPDCGAAPFGSAISLPAPDLSPVYAEVRGWQTVPVTAGIPYTLRANFAGGGNVKQFIELLDGDEVAPALATMTVADGEPTFGWRPAAVSGVPTHEYVTVRFRALSNAPDPHAIHVDQFSMAPCASSLSLSGISHTQGFNDQTLSGVAVSGSGFAGTPVLILAKQAGERGTVSNVVVQSASQLTCTLDLHGLSSGPYDLIVIQNDCVARLTSAIHVVGTEFVNGSFDHPLARGGCAKRVAGLPTGWSQNIEILRDGEVKSGIPTCPRPGDSLVLYGGFGQVHYASMFGADVGPYRAWQTVKVIPDRPVTLTGYFAGAGENTVRIALMEGTEFGTVIDSQTVFSGSHNTDWTPASVQAVPTTDTVTIMWEMSDLVGTGNAAHADGLVFSNCSDPSSDSDGDGDVDMTDFGAWQACFDADGIAPLSVTCRCFDDNHDGKIDIVNDFEAFAACAGGAGVQAIIACDD